MSDSEAINAIHDRMQQVRHDLGEEVEELVESARDMTDWRKYVKANPWICLAAAATVGFLIVPKKAQRYQLTDADLKSIAKQAGIKTTSNGGIRKTLVSLVGTAVLRGVMGYVGQQMTQQHVKSTEEARRF